MNETPTSTTVRHNDPDGPFGYVPTDDFGRAYDRMKTSELLRGFEARALAEAVVADEAWSIPIRAEYYRRAVANDDYARGVWEQVCERRGVAA